MAFFALVASDGSIRLHTSREALEKHAADHGGIVGDVDPDIFDFRAGIAAARAKLSPSEISQVDEKAAAIRGKDRGGPPLNSGRGALDVE